MKRETISVVVFDGEEVTRFNRVEPSPFMVRAKFKGYLRLLLEQKKRQAKGTFNPCGNASKAFYERKLPAYRKYLERWGHLLTINLKQKNETIQ